MKLWPKVLVFACLSALALPAQGSSFARQFYEGKKPAEIVGLSKAKHKEQLRITYIDKDSVEYKMNNQDLTLEKYHPSFSYKGMASSSLLKRRNWADPLNQKTRNKIEKLLITQQIKKPENITVSELPNLVTDTIYDPEHTCLSTENTQPIIYAPGYHPGRSSMSLQRTIESWGFLKNNVKLNF